MSRTKLSFDALREDAEQREATASTNRKETTYTLSPTSDNTAEATQSTQIHTDFMDSFEVEEERRTYRSLASRLNWLRAGVLGANDGIVSVAGVVIGVAAVNPTDTPTILLAGIAALLAGAFSMSVGEYVSVSTQRDTERAAVVKHQHLLDTDPEGQLNELAITYQHRGLSHVTARRVAAELTDHDALGAHLAVEHGIDADDLTNPWHAAISSFIAFTIGALLPVLTIVMAPPSYRIPLTFVSVTVALALTGWGSAHLGKAPKTRAVLRIVVGGAIAMAATWIIGHLLGVSGI